MISLVVMDSPGFNAKNLCHFMVEANSNYIIDIEILDKRHVGLASTNMEREAVKHGLERLTQDIKVVEFVTDASTSVKALLGMYNTPITLIQ
jgi:N-acetylglucosamine kinase-like BadF-type ATPase